MYAVAKNNNTWELITDSYKIIALILERFNSVITKQYNENNLVDKLWLHLGKKSYEAINASDIIYVEANNHHIQIQLTSDRRLELKFSLTQFIQEHLIEFKYLKKIGRKYVVNISRIDRIENNQLILEENHKIQIPRHRREEILKELGIILD